MHAGNLPEIPFDRNRNIDIYIDRNILPVAIDVRK